MAVLVLVIGDPTFQRLDPEASTRLVETVETVETVDTVDTVQTVQTIAGPNLSLGPRFVSRAQRRATKPVATT